MATSHLGISTEMTDVETERSKEAEACRLMYPKAFQKFIEDNEFSFSKKNDALALVEEDPTSEWGYAYRVPENCALFLRIESGYRKETIDQSIEYELAKDNAGGLIYTDQPEAIGHWVETDFDPSTMSANAQLAFSNLLAFLIAPRITGGDPFKLKDACYAAYQQFESKARIKNFNEQQQGPQAPSGFEQARRGGRRCSSRILR